MSEVDTSYVLDDDGHWVKRHERAEQLARRGILYGGFGPSRTEKAVVDPGPNKWIYVPYEGFDRKRFPTTFRTLLLFHSLPDWWKGPTRPGPYPDMTYGKKEGENDFQKEEETWDYDYYE